MFILEARSAKIEFVEHERLRAVVRRLHGSAYQALTEAMLLAVEEAAALNHGALDADWLAPQPYSSLRRLMPELLFGDTSMFVLAPAGKRLDAWEIRMQGRRSMLDACCTAVNTAVREGANAGADDQLPSWRPRSLQYRSTDDEDEELTQSLNDLTPEQRAAAHTLANDDARSFITDLVRSGSSISDFDDSPIAQYPSVAELHRYGLIEREYVIVCRQDHRTLGRISDLDDDARRSILQLSCPTCGRRFNDELLRQVHSPSRSAVGLVEHGRWRSAWASELLQQEGFDEHQITPLAGSGGNGMALRVETLHGRLLVELPEGEFGMQHANALIRRLRRHGIEFGLVLATEPVADDAYQYLSERVTRNQGPMVSVLEGSQAIKDELADAINEWSIISVRMLGEELIDTTGIDFGAIIEAWMRRQTEQRDEEDEDTLPMPTSDASGVSDDPGVSDDSEAAEPSGIGLTEDEYVNATITALPRVASPGGNASAS
jgi:hypothetical protein